MWLLASATAGWAQTTGNLSGLIRDPSGAVLPGADVTLRRADGSVTFRQQSGVRGGFGFTNLPIGDYEIEIAVDGFAPHVERLAIEASRHANLEVWLRLGIRGEPIHVRATDKLDLKSSRIGETVDAEMLQSIPTGRDVWVVLEQTPGVILDRFNVGGSESGQQSLFSGAGTSYAQNQYNLNGVNATDPAALGASSTYYSYDSFEEIQVSTAAHPAEVSAPGVFINIVLKSGGSHLSGGGAYYFEDDSLQSANLDDRLRAQGVSQSNRLKRYFDYSAELGGPIWKDRAFFFAQLAKQQIEPFVIGFFLPSGEPGVDTTELSSRLLRSSAALGDGHRLGGLFFRNNKLRPARDAGRLRPTPDTALYQDSTTDLYQLLYTGVWDDRFLLDGRISVMDMTFPLGERPDAGSEAFSRIELTSGIRSGGPGTSRLFERHRTQFNASIAHYRDDWLRGSHAFKVGMEHAANRAKTTDRLNGAILYRDFFGSPFQVEIYSDPTTVENHASQTSIFVQDDFTIGDWTLNLGARYDHWRSSYPTQPTGRGIWSDFFDSRGADAANTGQDVASFHSVAPRLGFTYRLDQVGRWLLRGNYSRYYHQIGTSLAAFGNPSGRAVALFSFEDANGNGLVDPGQGEIDLGSPLVVNLPTANEVDPSLRQPRTDEVSIGIDRELAIGLTLGASFIYRRDHQLMDDINFGVVRSDFSETTAIDPGDDLALGTEDDRQIVVFNQSRESLGMDQFRLTNPEGLDGTYRGLVLEARKRYLDGWQLLASLTLSESRGFLPGPGGESLEGGGSSTVLYNNPNTLIGAEGRTFWDRPAVLRVSTSYDLPFGLRVAALYRGQSGQPLYRTTQVSRAIDGTGLNQGPVEVIARSQGFFRQPAVHLLDARLERAFEFRPGRLSLYLDVFNAFNRNTEIETAQRLSTFGATLKILPPRVARLGIRFAF